MERQPVAVKVLILEDNPVARTFLCRVVRESFSDAIVLTEAGDLETARRHISLTGGAQGLHGVDPFKLVLDRKLPMSDIRVAYERMGSRQVLGKLLLVNA